jgi:hypothetical protein
LCQSQVEGADDAAREIQALIWQRAQMRILTNLKAGCAPRRHDARSARFRVRRQRMQQRKVHMTRQQEMRLLLRMLKDTQQESASLELEEMCDRAKRTVEDQRMQLLEIQKDSLDLQTEMLQLITVQARWLWLVSALLFANVCMTVALAQELLQH